MGSTFAAAAFFGLRGGGAGLVCGRRRGAAGMKNGDMASCSRLTGTGRSVGYGAGTQAVVAKGAGMGSLGRIFSGLTGTDFGARILDADTVIFLQMRWVESKFLINQSIYPSKIPPSMNEWMNEWIDQSINQLNEQNFSR